MVANYLTKLALFAAFVANSVSAGCTAERDATAHFQVLSYNDVYEMSPDSDDSQYGVLVGGPSRVIPIAKKLRQNFENSLVLFAGDTMAPSLWSGQFKGLQMIEAHNALGVDFACLGNHEFDFGIEGFLNVSVASKFPWLNANVYEAATGKLLRGTKPYDVKIFNSPTMGSIKIGVFGVLYDMQDTSLSLTWTNPIDAANAVAKTLREQENVDFVIALTHQNIDDDNTFSSKVKGVDLIYGGHDHTVQLQTNYGATFLKSDTNFRSIWISDIKYYAPVVVNTVKKNAFSKMSHKNLQITGAMPTDPTFDGKINEYSDKIAELFKRKVGSLCAPTDLTKNLVRKSDCPIGHFFTDALMNFYGKIKPNAAIMNGGGIRTEKVWPAGDITLGDIISWDPFGNIITIIETNGDSLKRFLVNQLQGNCGDNVINANGQYTHNAGFYFDFKCTGPSTGELVTAKWNNIIGDDIQDTDKVTLAFSDFLKGLFNNVKGTTSKDIISIREGARFEVVLEAYIKLQEGNLVCPNSNPVRGIVHF
uniref:Secreted protein n=1 Tax=Thraustotheca clavata TaxID=74557 RepID=A0A0A7CMQ3_9STRA|nr:secreted protein [Thraustotheca clavata]